MIGKSSPWGKVETCEQRAEGIWAITTASHGGFKLDRKHNSQVPDYMRRPGGWYEKDCEWAIVVTVFSRRFTREHGETARRVLRDWFPHDYARFYGTPVSRLRGESHQYDKECFYQENADKWIGISATIHGDGSVLVTATLGGKRGGVEERRYLVDWEQYQSRSHYGYVIREEDRLLS